MGNIFKSPRVANSTSHDPETVLPILDEYFLRLHFHQDTTLQCEPTTTVNHNSMSTQRAPAHRNVQKHGEWPILSLLQAVV